MSVKDSGRYHKGRDKPGLKTSTDEDVPAAVAAAPASAPAAEAEVTRDDKRKHVGHYVLGRTLGQGAFGKVILGTDIFTGENVAIKIISYKNVKSKREKIQLERERNILLRLKHPNIVRLLQVVDDQKRDKCYMIFEYVSGGELFDYIVTHGRLPENDARKFMRQIISAVEYCHSLLIVHRDLKPENLLLDKDLNIKISDFGLSNIMEPGKRFDTFCGSLHYACPEILRGEKYIGPGVDIWSMGIILYCLVVGRQPWDGTSATEIMNAILEDGLEIPSGVSDECVNLILSMLRVSEEDRISIAKMRHDKWVNEGYDELPQSYLPTPTQITEIDEEIMSQMELLGLIENQEDASKEILSNEKTQLLVTYNLLLAQKQEKLQKVKKDYKKMPKRSTSEVVNNRAINEAPLDMKKHKKKRTIVTSKDDIERKYETPEKKCSGSAYQVEGMRAKSEKKKKRMTAQSTPPKSLSKKLKKRKDEEETKEGTLLEFQANDVVKEERDHKASSSPHLKAEKKHKKAHRKSSRRTRSTSLFSPVGFNEDIAATDSPEKELLSDRVPRKPPKEASDSRNRASSVHQTPPRTDVLNLEDIKSGKISPATSKSSSSKGKKAQKSPSNRPSVINTFTPIPEQDKISPRETSL